MTEAGGGGVALAGGGGGGGAPAGGGALAGGGGGVTVAHGTQSVVVIAATPIMPGILNSCDGNISDNNMHKNNCILTMTSLTPERIIPDANNSRGCQL